MEHGIESWVFFLDLVKAFDHVPRVALDGFNDIWRTRKTFHSTESFAQKLS